MSWHFAHSEPNTTCLDHRKRIERAKRSGRGRGLRRGGSRPLEDDGPDADVGDTFPPPIKPTPRWPLPPHLPSLPPRPTPPPGPVPERSAFYVDLNFQDGSCEQYLILRGPRGDAAQLVMNARPGISDTLGLDNYPLASATDFTQLPQIGDARDFVRQELKLLVG